MKYDPVLWSCTHNCRRQSNYPTLPAQVTGKAYEVYHALYPGQTLARLNERGGFGVIELIAFLYAHNYPPQEWSRRVDEALARPTHEPATR